MIWSIMGLKCSLRQPDPAQQVGVARVGAEIVQIRGSLDVIGTLTKSNGFLQSRERSILLAELGVTNSSAIGLALSFGILGKFPQDSLVPRLLENFFHFLGTLFATR